MLGPNFKARNPTLVQEFPRLLGLNMSEIFAPFESDCLQAR